MPLCKRYRTHSGRTKLMTTLIILRREINLETKGESHSFPLLERSCHERFSSETVVSIGSHCQHSSLCLSWISQRSNVISDQAEASYLWSLPKSNYKQNMPLYSVFIHMIKTFDTISKKVLWILFECIRYPQRFGKFIHLFHDAVIGQVLSNVDMTEPFEISTSMK